VWDPDDLGFYTGGTDGLVFYWRLEDSQNKSLIFNQTGLNIESVAVANSDLCVYISGIYSQSVTPSLEQKCVYEVRIANKPPKERELAEPTKKVYPSEPFRIQTNSTISKMFLTHSEKLFFFTTNDKDQCGALRICKYPFTSDVHEIQSHFQGITNFKITFDDSQLFTVGLDGSIVIYQLTDEAFKVKLDKDGLGPQFMDEFLIPREKYKKKILKIDRLRGENNELLMKHEMKMHLQSKDRDEKLRELEDNIENLQRSEKEKFDALLESKRKMEQQFEEQKRTIK
jgi:WD40 repeat protein